MLDKPASPRDLQYALDLSSKNLRQTILEEFQSSTAKMGMGFALKACWGNEMFVKSRQVTRVAFRVLRLQCYTVKENGKIKAILC